MARIQLGESRLKARRRTRRLLRAGAVCGGLLLFVGGSIFLARASFFRITTVAVSGASAVPPTAIQTLVQQDIAGSYLFFYPKNNILLYPKHTVRQQLLGQFPTLKSADVHAVTLHTIEVVVAERQPAALWCGNASTSACFLLDAEGLAYAPAPTYSGDAYKKYVGEVAPAALPWQYLAPASFHSLSALVDALAKKESASTAARVSVDANNDVRLAFANGFVLLFTLGDDASKTLERFSLALTAAPFAAHSLADFEYLDLRFGDKLYYKLRD